MAAQVVRSGEAAVQGDASKKRLPLKELSPNDTDERPVLVFFHTPHEEGEKDPGARDSKKLCSITFNTEDTARAARLYRCLQVDTAKSDAVALKEAGVTAFPAVVVARANGEIVSYVTIGKQISPGKARSTLLGLIPKYFPEYSRKVEKRKSELEALYDQARAAMKKKDYKKALDLLNEIFMDDVRTDLLEKAFEKRQACEKKLADDE